MNERKDLTPEQTQTLADFADKLAAGRRVAVWIAHTLVGLGTLAGAITAVVTAWNAYHGHS